MLTQKKSFSIYGSNLEIVPFIVLGILICGILWSFAQLYHKSWVITNTWDLILFLNLSLCILVLAYMVYYAIKLHKEPVIIMNEQGITIYRFGFIPWHEISALSIVEKSGRILHERSLIIQLKNRYKLQPVTWLDKLFMHARWNAST